MTTKQRADKDNLLRILSDIEYTVDRAIRETTEAASIAGSLPNLESAYTPPLHCERDYGYMIAEAEKAEEALRNFLYLAEKITRNISEDYAD